MKIPKKVRENSVIKFNYANSVISHKNTDQHSWNINNEIPDLGPYETMIVDNDQT